MPPARLHWTCGAAEGIHAARLPSELQRLCPLTLFSFAFSLCCIAPVLAAKVLPGVEVTVGHEQEEGGKWPYAGTAEAIKAMGAKHCVKGVTISFPAAGTHVARGLPFYGWASDVSSQELPERRGCREPRSKAGHTPGLLLDPRCLGDDPVTPGRPPVLKAAVSLSVFVSS